jgi:hypothetical protein
MDAYTGTILDEETPRARLGLLLQHFSQPFARAQAAPEAEQ